MLVVRAHRRRLSAGLTTLTGLKEWLERARTFVGALSPKAKV